MSGASINVRINSTLKSEAQEILSDLGMDMSTAISIYLTQIVKRRAIPFTISDYDYNDFPPDYRLHDNEYTLTKSLEALEAGDKGISVAESTARSYNVIKAVARHDV